MLLVPEEAHYLADAESYAASWRRGPWAPPPESLKSLPYGTRGELKPFWKPKAKSFEALVRLLGPGEGRIVIDAGAGTGWLSHQLSRQRFSCFATDVSGDPVVGLGAAEAFDRTAHGFERAIASLSRWPIGNQAAHVAVCNASLHYLSDITAVLNEARRVLRPEGRLFIMNSPVHRDARSARKAAMEFRNSLRGLGARGALVDDHRHFVAADLESELRSVFREVRRHDPAFGPWFRLVRAMKGLVLRMELASFPIYEARNL